MEQDGSDQDLGATKDIIPHTLIEGRILSDISGPKEQTVRSGSETAWMGLKTHLHFHNPKGCYLGKQVEQDTYS